MRQSTTLLWLLLGWTFTIVFLPFPTGLVAGSSGNDALTKLLYIGTMAVSSTMLASVALVIGRDRRLRDTDERPDIWSSTGTAGAFVLGIAVSLEFPVSSYWPLLLLLLVDPVGHLVRQRRASER